MDISFRLERVQILKLERDFWDTCYEAAKQAQASFCPGMALFRTCWK